jgi:arginine/lysine/histidine/glutamine transport system substrate-binding and permease protein
LEPAFVFEFLQLFLDALPSLVEGAIVTLELAFGSIFLGAIAGSLIGIARLSPIALVRIIAGAYVDFFRGTPLLVQIFMVYFGLPALAQKLGFSLNWERFFAAVAALSLNCAAYIAEIIRAGIQSIDRGQTEAAKSLGMKPLLVMCLIIFPQAFRRMIPPLGNEFIALLKDTSLVAVIGMEELFRQGQLIVATNYRAFEIYTTVALIYLFLTLFFSQGFNFLERWMNPIKSQKS